MILKKSNQTTIKGVKDYSVGKESIGTVSNIEHPVLNITYKYPHGVRKNENSYIGTLTRHLAHMYGFCCSSL